MSKYVIKYGESIIDVSVKLYGTPTYVFDLITLNPILLNVDNIAIVGLEIDYNDINFIPNEVITDTTTVIVKSVTFGEGQSIFDLSLQLYGNLEKVFDIAKISNISSISEVGTTGISFSYVYEPLKFPKYFNDNKIKLSTKNPIIQLVSENNTVWDGVDDIWDGVYDLAY